MGSLDHLAVLSTISIATLRDASMKRTNWLWGKTNWVGLGEKLLPIPLHDILTRDVDTKVGSITSAIHSLQSHSHNFTAKPHDQPWTDGSVAIQSNEEVEVLAANFSEKISVSDRGRLLPAVSRIINAILSNIELIPKVHAYADDCTFTFPCNTTDHRVAVALINTTLETIAAWGRHWQVNLIQDKTQPSRSPHPIYISYGWDVVFLPPLEPWSPRYGDILPITALQHRRHKACLCAMYKIHREGAPHPTTLRQPWATPRSHGSGSQSGRYPPLGAVERSGGGGEEEGGGRGAAVRSRSQKFERLFDDLYTTRAAGRVSGRRIRVRLPHAALAQRKN
ncbi:hypothetical protein O3P69_019061 [Scylla paramamosain]|uniref:Reverse transcriptase domain-containing protein n=1 Tax=Scylla paramamosain TaxID=85552 RepID=A0AAW0T7S7_SCYPA